MKRRILVLAFLFVFFACCGCSGPGVQKIWGSVRRAQIAPVSFGKAMFVDQEVFGLAAADGTPFWTSTVKGAKRVFCRAIGDYLFVFGDSRIIERVGADGKTAWRFEAPQGSGVWLLSSSKKVCVLAYDSDTDYDLNPIQLIGLSAADGQESWRLDDRDYQACLMVPDSNFFTDIFVAPFSRGETVWFDGISSADGSQVWRTSWGIQRPGHPLVLAQDETRFWAWKAEGGGVRVAVFSRTDGHEIGSSVGPSGLLADASFVGENVFIAFKDAKYRINALGKYEKFGMEYFPVCQVPDHKSLAVCISDDCSSFVVMDIESGKVFNGFKINACYSAFPGHSFGEFYLVPEVSPYDHQTFRCQFIGDREIATTKIPSDLKGLGKNRSLKDLFLDLMKARLP
ncbi:MAG: PQQ-binding-like beta-propeller repeat protein [Caldisericales bacterium]|nr:PQQ-binding-like beta-propeller repeat protein [Caldisericales bacterium]